MSVTITEKAQAIGADEVGGNLGIVVLHNHLCNVFGGGELDHDPSVGFITKLNIGTPSGVDHVDAVYCENAIQIWRHFRDGKLHDMPELVGAVGWDDPRLIRRLIGLLDVDVIAAIAATMPG
jgi:hypothetical protein